MREFLEVLDTFFGNFRGAGIIRGRELLERYLFFSGLCGSLLLGTGFLGSIATGLIVDKFGHMEEVAKIFFAIASLGSILIAEFLRKSQYEAVIALSCALFGIFGFGMYPMGLELSVENTYPVDETAGTALIFLSGQIQGALLIMISGLMEQDLKDPSVSVSEDDFIMIIPKWSEIF